MGAAPKNSPGLCEVWPAVPRSKTPTVGGAGCTRGFPDSGLPAVLSPRVHLRMRGRGVVWPLSRVRGPSLRRAVSSHREEQLGQGGPSSRSGAFFGSGSTADPTGQKVGQSYPRVGHARGPSNTLPSEDLDGRRNSEF